MTPVLLPFSKFYSDHDHLLNLRLSSFACTKRFARRRTQFDPQITQIYTDFFNGADASLSPASRRAASYSSGVLMFRNDHNSGSTARSSETSISRARDRSSIKK